MVHLPQAELKLRRHLSSETTQLSWQICFLASRREPYRNEKMFIKDWLKRWRVGDHLRWSIIPPSTADTLSHQSIGLSIKRQHIFNLQDSTELRSAPLTESYQFNNKPSTNREAPRRHNHSGIDKSPNYQIDRLDWEILRQKISHS